MEVSGIGAQILEEANTELDASGSRSPEVCSWSPGAFLLELQVIFLPAVSQPFLKDLLPYPALPILRYKAKAAALGCLPATMAERASLPAFVGKRAQGAFSPLDLVPA